MTIGVSSRTGVLILRLWVEAHQEHGLRARITQSDGATAAESSVAVAGSAGEIVAVVQRWVDGFIDPDSLHEGN